MYYNYVSFFSLRVSELVCLLVVFRFRFRFRVRFRFRFDFVLIFVLRACNISMLTLTSLRRRNRSSTSSSSVGRYCRDWFTARPTSSLPFLVFNFNFIFQFLCSIFNYIFSISVHFFHFRVACFSPFQRETGEREAGRAKRGQESATALSGDIVRCKKRRRQPTSRTLLK